MEQSHHHLKSEQFGNVLVLTILERQVEGDTIAEELRSTMLQALGASECRHAVIDLQHIQYISSAAFRPLLALRRSLRERGGRLVLCGLNPVVGDIFFTTRMVDPDATETTDQPTPIFELQPSVPEAIALLQKAAEPSKDQA
jgi:anti-anti-sigma factor